MNWGALTAIGTLALAAMTLAAVVVTVAITVQDPRRADERSRRERLWSDAELVAEVKQLLVDLYPPRRGMSAARGPAEAEIWQSLYQRTGLAETRLRTMAAAHSSADVRAEAEALPRKLWGAYMGTRAFVSKQEGHGPDLSTSISDAQTHHEDAEDALGKMEGGDRVGRERWESRRGQAKARTAVAGSGPLARGVDRVLDLVLPRHQAQVARPRSVRCALAARVARRVRPAILLLADSLGEHA
jgi:hypothetical protein